jgi:hypothetical protein
MSGTIAMPMALILGCTTLSQANWLFNFRQRRWAITKWPGTSHD